MNVADINHLIDVAQRAGVKHLRWVDRYGATVEVIFKDGQIEGRVTVDPKQAAVEFTTAPMPGQSPQPLQPVSTSTEMPFADRDWCACGHSIGVEHNTAGCLHGCPESVCNSKPPEAEPPKVR